MTDYDLTFEFALRPETDGGDAKTAAENYFENRIVCTATVVSNDPAFIQSVTCEDPIPANSEETSAVKLLYTGTFNINPHNSTPLHRFDNHYISKMNDAFDAFYSFHALRSKAQVIKLREQFVYDSLFGIYAKGYAKGVINPRMTHYTFQVMSYVDRCAYIIGVLSGNDCRRADAISSFITRYDDILRNHADFA